MVPQKLCYYKFWLHEFLVSQSFQQAFVFSWNWIQILFKLVLETMARSSKVLEEAWIRSLSKPKASNDSLQGISKEMELWVQWLSLSYTLTRISTRTSKWKASKYYWWMLTMYKIYTLRVYLSLSLLTWPFNISKSPMHFVFVNLYFTFSLNLIPFLY